MFQKQRKIQKKILPEKPLFKRFFLFVYLINYSIINNRKSAGKGREKVFDIWKVLEPQFKLRA